jgi:hypothetical protein
MEVINMNTTDSEFKVRVNDLYMLSEAFIKAVDAFYDSGFDNDKLELIRVAYMKVAVLISSD